MRDGMRLALALLAAALLLPAPGGGADADGRRTLTGMYTSGYQDRPASLRAVFTPAGDRRQGERDGQDEWTVVFHFTRGGQRHEYRGTAVGNLSSGEISGRVETEDGDRTFTFRCAFEGRKCKGTHAEVGRRSGRERETGTLTLRG